MGEGQKPVSKAYKDNWNDIFGKKKKRFVGVRGFDNIETGVTDHFRRVHSQQELILTECARCLVVAQRHASGDLAVAAIGAVNGKAVDQHDSS
jgi:hypothetical protein